MKKIIEIIKSIFFIGGFVAFFIWIIFLIINTFSYFDPINLCYISIKGDVVSGNEKTIHLALKEIKKTDSIAYSTVCNYATTIVEKKFCKIGDDRVDKSLPDFGIVEPPCYIKGSKIIYLKSEKEESKDIIDRRIKNIIEYANKSKMFWDLYNK